MLVRRCETRRGGGLIVWRVPGCLPRAAARSRAQPRAAARSARSWPVAARPLACSRLALGPRQPFCFRPRPPARTDHCSASALLSPELLLRAAKRTGGAGSQRSVSGVLVSLARKQPRLGERSRAVAAGRIAGVRKRGSFLLCLAAGCPQRGGRPPLICRPPQRRPTTTPQRGIFAKPSPSLTRPKPPPPPCKRTSPAGFQCVRRRQRVRRVAPCGAGRRPRSCAAFP
jgi:hypothetical protein